jgi:PIN domain nuclease of toxin-antitoxin system
MIQAVADTHTVIWYLFRDARLSNVARFYIEDLEKSDNQVAFSSITLAEIVYLAERNRIHAETLSQFLQLVDSKSSAWQEVPFDRLIATSMQNIEKTQIPELADRIIVATALHLNVPVITRDHKIQASHFSTIW